jgi:hypothetical protein
VCRIRQRFAGGGEIVGVMDGDGAGQAAERRRAALTAFLGAGLPSAPARALVVAALAGARRAVAAHQARGQGLDEWLAGEVGVRGIRENAAVLAVLELPARRGEAAQAFCQAHPDRAGVLGDLLAVIDQPGSAAR